MKRAVRFVLMAMLVMSMTACGNKQSGANEDAGAAEADGEASIAPEMSIEPEAEEVEPVPDESLVREEDISDIEYAEASTLEEVDIPEMEDTTEVYDESSYGKNGEHISPCTIYEDDNIKLSTDGFGEWTDEGSSYASSGLTVSVENKTDYELNLVLSGMVSNGYTCSRQLGGWKLNNVPAKGTVDTGIEYNLYPFKKCKLKTIDTYWGYGLLGAGDDTEPVYFKADTITSDVSDSPEFDISEYEVLNENDLYKMYIKKTVPTSESDGDFCDIFIENKTNKRLSFDVFETLEGRSTYGGIKTRVWCGAKRRNDALDDGQLILDRHEYTGDVDITIDCYVYENWWDSEPSEEHRGETVVHKFK